MSHQPGREFAALEFSPEDVDRLSPAELEDLAAGLDRLVGGETPHQFIARLWPHEVPPPHLQPILDIVEAARMRQVMCCLSMPPGHAKTTTLLRSIVWWLDKSRTDTCAYVSYNMRQGYKKSRECKKMALHAGLQIPAHTSAAGEWKLHEGGGLLAGSARSGLTGNRVPGLLVYDDPYADASEARSPTIRETIRDNLKSVALTRMQGGSCIVQHTRWDDDDLIGWLTREMGWPLINVPAVSEEGLPDALGREPGIAAWPSHYPTSSCPGPCGHDGHLDQIRKGITDYWWYALYQGSPRVSGKAVFHEPARFRLSEFSWRGKRGVISIDPAATAKTSADHSVLQVSAMEGYGTDSRMYVLDVHRVQCEIPQLVRLARDLQRRYNLLVACEAVAGFKAVPQMLRDSDPKLRVIEISTGGKDKFLRSQALAAAWNDGRVMVPVDAPWDTDGYVKEHLGFTGVNDVFDDRVDADAHGWNTLYREKKRDRGAWHEAVL